MAWRKRARGFVAAGHCGGHAPTQAECRPPVVVEEPKSLSIAKPTNWLKAFFSGLLKPEPRHRRRRRFARAAAPTVAQAQQQPTAKGAELAQSFEQRRIASGRSASGRLRRTG